MISVKFTFEMRDLELRYSPPHGRTMPEAFFATYHMVGGGTITVDLIPEKHGGGFYYSIHSPDDINGKRHLTGFQPFAGEALTGFEVLQAMIDDWPFILYDFECQFPHHYFYKSRDGAILMFDMPLLYLSVDGEEYHGFKPAFSNKEALTRFYNSIFQSDDLAFHIEGKKKQGIIREVPQRRTVWVSINE